MNVFDGKRITISPFIYIHIKLITGKYGFEYTCISKHIARLSLKLAFTFYRSTSTFANSEDPDEMQHNAAFHQGLYYICICKGGSSDKRIQYLKMKKKN